jgi:hypothetical protein
MTLQRRRSLGRGKSLQPGGPLARTAGLASVTPLQRSGPLKPVSGKRRAENAERRTMIAGLTGGERPLCAVWELRQPDWCTRWADDAHEPLTRARLGSITDPGNVRFVCRPCHDVLTFTPESQLGWAYAAGLLRHSGLCCQDRPVCSQLPEEAA